MPSSGMKSSDTGFFPVEEGAGGVVVPGGHAKAMTVSFESFEGKKE